MKKRPPFIILFALLHFSYPLVYFFQVVYLNDLSLAQYWPAARQVFDPTRHPVICVFSLSALFLGYGLLKVRIWAYWLFLLNSTAALAVNLLHVTSQEIAGSVTVLKLLSVALTIAVVFYFLRSQIRAPYFHPRLRWWLSDPRFSSEHLYIEFSSFSRFAAGRLKVYDISRSGAFVLSEDLPDLSEQMEFRLYINDDTPLSGRGEVTRTSPAAPDLPAGFGFRFLKLTRRQKKQLDRYLQKYSRVKRD